MCRDARFPRWVLLAAGSLAILAPVDLLAQCAMCARAIEAGPGAQSPVAAGFYWSILFLLGTVAVLATALVAAMARAVRASTTQPAEEPEVPHRVP